MKSNAIIQNRGDSTGKVVPLPGTNINTESKKQPQKIIIRISNASTEAPQYDHNEVESKMAYSTADKILPQKDTIDLILKSLDSKEKEELLQELLYAAVRVISTGKAEYIEAMRHLIAAWEYTAEIEANPALAKDIDETRKSVIDDQSPGVEWRELLRG